MFLGLSKNFLRCSDERAASCSNEKLASYINVLTASIFLTISVKTSGGSEYK